MTLKQLVDEFRAAVKDREYSVPEAITLLQAEEEDWLPENILALSAAYEYLNKVDNQPEAQFLRAKYSRLLDELKETYSVRN